MVVAEVVTGGGGGVYGDESRGSSDSLKRMALMVMVAIVVVWAVRK